MCPCLYEPCQEFPESLWHEIQRSPFHFSKLVNSNVFCHEFISFESFLARAKSEWGAGCLGRWLLFLLLLLLLLLWQVQIWLARWLPGAVVSF